MGMCSRVLTLVFTVTLHILTVSNCTESRPFPVHCLMHGHAPCTYNQKLHRVGTGCGVLAGTVEMLGDRSYWQDDDEEIKLKQGSLEPDVDDEKPQALDTER